MPKTAKKIKAGFKPLFTVAPWTCAHYTDHSTIAAHVEATGRYEIIAEVMQSAGVDAELTAAYMVRALNDYVKFRDVTQEMVAALEICLQCEGLSWAAEHDALVTVERAKTLLQ